MKLKDKLLATGIIVTSFFLLTGCTEVNYNVTVDNKETYTVVYEVKVDKNKLEKALEETGQDDPKKYVDRYIEDLKKADDFKESSDGTVLAFQIVSEGEVLPERAPSGDMLFVSQNKKGEELVVNLPLYKMLPPEVTQVENLNYVFTEFEVTASFPGQVKHTNFNGSSDIFTKTVTWDTNSVVESIKKKQPLTAVANSSEFFLFSPFAGIIVLALGILFVIVQMIRRKAHAVKLKKLADDEAAMSDTDWDASTPEAWALKQIAKADPKNFNTPGK